MVDNRFNLLPLVYLAEVTRFCLKIMQIACFSDEFLLVDVKSFEWYKS